MKINSENQNGRKCFSYIRYSSKRQSKGSSEWRQLEIAPRVAAEKGWILDDSLAMEDLGKSGFKGDNVATIKSIISKANAGIIQSGTVCIIECLDRATRLVLDDAYQLIRDLLKSGIEIYEDKTQRHLTAKDLNEPMSVMLTVVSLHSAFQYSANLSDRVKKSWQSKRMNPTGGKLTKNGTLSRNVPAWIKPETHEINFEKANVVKRIFEMYLNGNGLTTIAKTLNGEKIQPFGHGEFWDTCYIGKLLQNPIVIGELHHKTASLEEKPNGKIYKKRVATGEVTKNFYPAVISEDMFHLASEKFRKSFKTRARKNDTTANIFAGVATCVCGKPMNKIKSKYATYIQCRGRSMNHGCQSFSMRYDPLEHAFLQIIGDDMHLFLDKTEHNLNQVEVLTGQIKSIEKQVQNITDAVLDGRASKSLVTKQIELESKLEELRKDLTAASFKNNAKVNDYQDVSDLKNNLGNFATDYPMRAKVRDFCLSHIESMVVDTKKKTATIIADNKRKFEIEIDEHYAGFKLNGVIWYL